MKESEPYIPYHAERPRSIFELDHTRCRFPIGASGIDGVRFCGGEAVPGRSYCPHHHKFAYITRGRH
jgi:hypothetical protein